MIYLLPHLIREVAAVAPDRVAIRCRGQNLTYGDLEQRSNALANTLIDLGVRKGDRVGILLNKSLECAVAVYGIMTAGAVYVPLDPSAPSARLEFVIRDCGIRHLVSESAKHKTLQALFAGGVELEAIVGVASLEGPTYRTVTWESVNEREATSPATGVTEQDLCYILYTSGSTGIPKGIMHTHRSALAWAEVSAAAYGLGPRDVISNYAPLHFDLSTLDYYGGARAGATTVIIPEEYTKLPASLASLIEDERLTLFYTVPMALIQLARPGVLDGRDFADLQQVLFGGEPMPIKHLRALQQKLPHVHFVNVYGPTETNGCTHFPITQLASRDDEALPIGKPYDNVEAMVVDEQEQPVPPGEVGELLIRAPTMMRGYWGRPDLNETAFAYRQLNSGLPDIFHRTGDLVSVREDGNFRFLGRKDRQIKSRGCRVDLDEVETALLAHQEVDEAAVYPVADEDGSLLIHAAVIPKPDRSVTTTDLSQFLRKALPPYAVPVALVLRENFPRTSSGKIDRRKLQADAHSHDQGDGAHAAAS
jgi:amino acid adenylation domain-containing protein